MLPVFNESYCLRRRLRGFTCSVCIDRCIGGAISEHDGIPFIDTGKCMGCGVCTTVCPADAFQFADFDLNESLFANTDCENVVISCHNCHAIFVREMRVPCLGALTAEALIYLGMQGRGEMYINTAGCEGCVKNRAVMYLAERYRKVQKLLGHLFTAKILMVNEWELLPVLQQQDRRSFLTHLRQNIAGLVTDHVRIRKESAEESVPAGRRIPGRLNLLRKLIAHAGNERLELIQKCTPSVTVLTSCLHCPLCTGMCPTGALKITKVELGKSLAIDLTLCTGCGLCAAFCKQSALHISQPAISPW